MNKLLSKLLKFLKSEKGGISYATQEKVPNELIKQYGIKDLVDLKELKKLFDEFTHATGFTIGFLDHPDLNILIQSNWRRICTDFHRKCPKSLKNCLKSNHKLLDKLNKPGQVVIEKCENGMVDCATPIIIGGKHLASLATGQMLLKEPDIDRFKKQAKLFGYDEKKYLKALSEVKVIKKKELANTTKFLGDLAIIVSRMGYEKLQFLKEQESLRKKEEELKIKDVVFRESQVSNSISDEKGILKEVNRTFLKLVGVSSEKEVIGKSVLNFFKVPRDGSELLKALKKNEKWHGEINVARKDGKALLVYGSITAIKNKKGKVIGYQSSMHDITDRRKAEESLVENESLLNETSKIAKVGGWEFNVKDLKLKWSEEVYKIHEVNKSSFKPTIKKAINFYTPSSRPVIEKAVNEAIKYKKPFDVELEVITSKGNHRWVHAIGKFISLGNGNGKISGIFQDITDRKKVEIELLNAEEKYRGTISAMSDLIFVLDKDGRFTYCHSPKNSLLYLSPKKIIGKKVSEVMPLNFVKLFNRCFGNNKKGESDAFDYALEMNDGLKHFNARFSPIMNGDIFQGVVAVVRDITSRIKVEEELKESKLLAERYLQMAGVVMVALDIDGRITLLNKKGYNLLGYKQGELIGRNWFDLVIPKNQREDVKKVFRDIMRGEVKQLESYTNPVITKNGEIRDVHWHNALLKNDNGEIIGTLSSGEDITERKRMEEELKKSKVQIENISNNLEGGMIYQTLILKDGTRKVVYISDKVKQFYGVTPEEVLKDSSLIYKKVHPGDIKKLREAEEQANKNLSVFKYEARMINPDGSIRSSYFVSAPKRLPDGTTSWDGIELDITDRKKIEEKLRESRKSLEEEVKKRTSFLNSILENIPDMIFVKEAGDLRFELFNKAGEDLLGYKREDLIGKNDYDFFPIKEADFFVKKDRMTLENKTLVDIPEEIISTKGGPRYLHTKKIPILDEKGNPRYLLGISEDITERKELQDKLKEYAKGLEKKVEERTKEMALTMAQDKAILESIGEGLVVFSDILEDKGKIIYVNKAFEEITGWKSEEVVNNSNFNLKMSDSEETSSSLLNKNIYNKILKGEKITTGIIKPSYYFRKDGTKFPVASAITPIISEGKVIGLVDVFRDVTKELQVDRAKTEFVSLASHQLRTPLSVIKWYTEALLSEKQSKTVNKEKYLEEVHHGNERMIKLVNNLLNIARLEMGKLNVNNELVNSTKLLQEIVDSHKPKIEEKKQKITIESKDVPDTYIDIELLRMVLSNIIFNSVKYTPEKGEISCKIRQNKGNILFEISDNGIGIPEKEQSKIFEKLYRASNALVVDREGAGLGLYLVKEIVKIIGGSIRFKSKFGEGTTFYIEIPIKNKL